MVFPLWDDNSDRTTTPLVNYAIIALNIFVFVVLQRFGTDTQFTYSFSTVPWEIITGRDAVSPSHVVVDAITGQRFLQPGLGETPVSVYLTLFTSMFMHGGIAHIGGNMLFLWIFGDNVEDAFGHVLYLIFYLVCGIVASLAQVLREELGFTGTKIACNEGHCGACTVQVDGTPILSCITLAHGVSGEVTTIEGLRDHALVDAFVRADAVQCGFCTPGQVVSAAALVASSPSPTVEEIRHRMAGNICRCGTYPRIEEAILHWRD